MSVDMTNILVVFHVLSYEVCWLFDFSDNFFGRCDEFRLFAMHDSIDIRSD